MQINKDNTFKVVNLGCGKAKISGAINVDSSDKVNPDIIASIKGTLPFEDSSIDQVLLFHCIEHIEQAWHEHVLDEIWRFLKPNGTFVLSFPEFSKILQNWLDNKNGERRFWEAAIYGRQLYPGDYHFSAIHTSDMKLLLERCGFIVDRCIAEPICDYNGVIYARKGNKPLTYEEVVYREIFTK